jgi:hypothetical protein
VEIAFRESVLHEAKQRLEAVLNQADRNLAAPGQNKGQQTREVLSLVGPLQLTRSYRHGWTEQGEQMGFYPLDEVIGLVGRYTPGAARLITRLAAQMPFAELEDTLRESAGLQVDARSMHRLLEETAPQLAGAQRSPEPALSGTVTPTLYLELDGTGIPMRKDELVGRAGRQPDGTARTREAKLGAVFMQKGVDEEGHPMRDPDSTTYVGTLGGADEIAEQLRSESLRRGMAQAKRVVAIGDGAAWIWERFRQLAPAATCVLDFYHACEHLGRLARALDGADELAVERRCKRWRADLKESRLQRVLDEAKTQEWAAAQGGCRRNHLFRKQSNPNGLPSLPSRWAVLRIGRGGSWMQNGDWYPNEAVRDVLGGRRSRRNVEPSLYL